MHVAVNDTSAIISEDSDFVLGDINRYRKATWGSPVESITHCDQLSGLKHLIPHSLCVSVFICM